MKQRLLLKCFAIAIITISAFALASQAKASAPDLVVTSSFVPSDQIKDLPIPVTVKNIGTAPSTMYGINIWIVNKNGERKIIDVTNRDGMPVGENVTFNDTIESQYLAEGKNIIKIIINDGTQPNNGLGIDSESNFTNNETNFEFTIEPKKFPQLTLDKITIDKSLSETFPVIGNEVQVNKGDPMIAYVRIANIGTAYSTDMIINIFVRRWDGVQPKIASQEFSATSGIGLIPKPGEIMTYKFDLNPAYFLDGKNTVIAEVYDVDQINRGGYPDSIMANNKATILVNVLKLIKPSVKPDPCDVYVFSDWGSCVNNIQIRTLLSTHSGECTNDNPILSRSCGELTKEAVSVKSSGYFAKVKGGSGDIFYIESGTKHRVLNPTVMKSWYYKNDLPSSKGVDWAKANVKEIASSSFNTLANGGDVGIKPKSKFLVQFGLNSSIYAVGENAKLYAVKGPSVASKYFGADWGKRVVIFPKNYNDANRYTITGEITNTSGLPY